MNQARPERGTKRTCLSCESRFYDLARVPATCPKCGAEYVEIVRPAPAYQPRRKGAFGKGAPSRPFEAEDGRSFEADEPQAGGEDREPDDENEEEMDEDRPDEAEEPEE